MKIKPATELHAHCLQNALDALIIARAQLHMAECPQALAAVRRALKSAEGAQRHMQRRLHADAYERAPASLMGAHEPLAREADYCPACDVANAPEALRCIACATPLQG